MIRPITIATLLATCAVPALAQQAANPVQPAPVTAPLAPTQSEPDDLSVPVQPTPTLAPDAASLARDAATRGDNAEALSRYLRILSSAPDNVAALVGAGKAALAVGDMNAAAGFLARADALDPRNGEVKAGLATTMLERGDARASLRMFKEATDLGVVPATIAADRGLAYDLRGDQKRAQADYMVVLRSGPNDEITRRLAISQAIGGDRVTALATLDPLLRKQDVPAWRARAFVLALTGDVAEAQAGAALVMPSDQAAALAPYLARLATLKNAEKAAAIHLGRFPGEGDAAAPATRQASAAPPPRIQIDRAMLGPAQAPADPQPPVQVAQAAPPPPPVPAEPVLTPAERAADARAKRLAAANAAKEKQKRQQEAEEKAAAKRNPARHWVQIAGGANKRDLGKEWSKLKAKWPGQLAGRSPWTTHYRYTNRLLIGPFATSDAAQDWVSDRKKEGLATFRVETANGDLVERVD
jgi:Flp pilus assembly protein TadD